jgi:protein phosphatase
VGDSRLYRLRDGALEALTHEHSLLNDVVELHPELDDSAVAKLPRKAVTRALGMEETVRVSVATHRAYVGDRYLLCTDGLTGELGGSLLAEMLGAAATPPEIVQDLIRAAKEHGGRDNITALVIECRAASFSPSGKTPNEAKSRPRSSSSPKHRKPPLPKREAYGSADDPQIEVTHDTDGSNPEIILLRRTKIADDTDPRISVVPAESADAQMIRVLDRLADNLTPTLAQCSQCQTAYEGTSVYCPRCGAAQDEPLSRR